MFQELVIIPCGKVSPPMGSSALSSHQGTHCDYFCEVKHVLQFECPNERKIESLISMSDLDILETLLETSNLLECVLQFLLNAIHSNKLVHYFAHLLAD